MTFSHWLFKLPLIRRFDAICIGRLMLFKASKWKVSMSLIKHEMIHQDQMDRHGVLKFYLIYLSDFLRMFWRYRDWMKAYRSIPFEIEAYGS